MTSMEDRRTKVCPQIFSLSKLLGLYITMGWENIPNDDQRPQHQVGCDSMRQRQRILHVEKSMGSSSPLLLVNYTQKERS